MEVYAAMIDCLDQGVGRIVDTLKEQGKFENTLILFLADNGGCAEEFGSNGQNKVVSKDAKPLPADGLQTAMVPPITRDGKPVRQGRGVMPGPADT
jgi:arylsulfatase